MTTPYPTRRTGLGRHVADIVGGPEPDEPYEAPGGLLAGPAVVPLDLLPFPMLVADHAGQILAVNQRWVRLTGLSSQQSLGSGWLAALRPEDRGPLSSLVQAVGAGAPGRRVEYPLAAFGGALFSWWLAAHRRAGERLVGIAVGEADGRVEPQKVEWRGVERRGVNRRKDQPDARPPLSADPILDQLPALLRSIRTLLNDLEAVVERLPGCEGVPA